MLMDELDASDDISVDKYYSEEEKVAENSLIEKEPKPMRFLSDNELIRRKSDKISVSDSEDKNENSVESIQESHETERMPRILIVDDQPFNLIPLQCAMRKLK